MKTINKRNQLQKKIRQVEEELDYMESGVLNKLTPSGIAKELTSSGGGSSSPVPGLIATGLSLGVKNPVAKIVLPIAGKFVANQLSEPEIQLNFISRLKKAMNWVANRTTLSLEEEQYMLSEEINTVQFDIENEIENRVTETLEPIEVIESNLEGSGESKVPLKVEEASWY
ncbi:hypothetical protein [Jiulongibacter sp. NS-SX5]|uniref:hypothetical protein n=1 Tax=Jiulongibacter sp. NS-SX5 TaxID=3463854 RepID=UPI004057EAA3